MTKHSEKRRKVQGRSKTRSKNPIGNAPWGTKIVRFDHSHFVWSDWFDMTRLRTKNGASHQCILLPILVINPSHFFVFSL